MDGPTRTPVLPRRRANFTRSQSTAQASLLSGVSGIAGYLSPVDVGRPIGIARRRHSGTAVIVVT
jgi:hypothetical protein